MEIERKFLVAEGADPTAGLDFLYRIEQSYFYDDQSTSARVRQLTTATLIEHWLTLKSAKSWMEREEVEVPISAQAYRVLRGDSVYSTISKTRFRVQQGTWVFDVDVFDGSLAGLRLAELEFPDKFAADCFRGEHIPWLGQEVTKDHRYLNSELARTGEVPKL